VTQALLAPFVVVVVACGTEAPAEPAAVSTHVGDWRDEVIYQLLVDRFDDADDTNDTIDGVSVEPGDLARFQGGDWRGVTRRLDYIRRMGFTAVWISPVVDNVQRTEMEDGYHGYWARDFTEVNPRYGSLEDLRELVREAHARGMLVIVDVVVNHAGRVFAYDLDANGAVSAGEIEPPYSADGPWDAPLIWLETPPRVFDAAGEAVELGADAYHRRGFGDLSDETQKELGDFPTGLRDLATTRDDVIARLVDTWARWVELTDVDGFRLDAVPHVEEAFWPRFSRALRERLDAMGKRRFLLLGEVFDARPEVMARYVAPDALDSVFDFAFKHGVIDAFVLEARPPAEVAVRPLAMQRAAYNDAPQPLGVELAPYDARVAFADNHDTWRLRAELDDPLAAELAITAVYTVDAIPCVYYGTEQELDGDVHHEHREPLWPTGFREDTRMWAHLVRLAHLRREHEALRYGTLTVRYASDYGGRDAEPDAALLAWERAFEGDRVLVILNAHAFQPSEARVPTGFAAGTVLRDVLWDSVEPTTVSADGSAVVRVPPRAAAILVAD
jgi:glycosidase